jgi:hypothetical protein
LDSVALVVIELAGRIFLRSLCLFLQELDRVQIDK